MLTKSIYKPEEHIFFEDQIVFAFTHDDVEEAEKCGISFKDYVNNKINVYIRDKHIDATFVKLRMKGFKMNYILTIVDYELYVDLWKLVENCVNSLEKQLVDLLRNPELPKDFNTFLLDGGLLLDIAMCNNEVILEKYDLYYDMSKLAMQKYLESMKNDNDKSPNHNNVKKVCK